MKNLKNAISNGTTDGNSIGQRVVIPTSFTGGPRYMIQNYRDAMAICKWIGYPDLFITMTCNPKWPEVTRFLDGRGLKSEDRPDILCRIFKIKVDQIIKDMTELKIFGKTRAVIYTIEFQKRGLPHAHILLFLDRENKFPSSDDVDQIISAEIPNKETDAKLHELVTQHMIHGPCTSKTATACMKNGKCTKGFPKKISEQTTVDDNGYPIYKRRNTEVPIMKNGIPIDNTYVVSYSPQLLLRYQAHINVEWCNQLGSVKYLFKYINKGNDRVTMSISERSKGVGDKEEVVDEIKNYFNCRYISPCEAAWRIFGYDIHYRNPPVQRLSFHLLGEDEHYYDDDEPIQKVVDEAEGRKSMFTAWMQCNKEHPHARNLLYTEFPNKFVWDGTQQIWTVRRSGISIGRLDYVPPGVGEAHYLSLMLHYSRGPTSHEEIRTINNVVYPDFKSACYSLGLLGDDKEYIDGIKEASFWALPNFLRKLFASLLLSGSVSRPEYLWENTWRILADDILRRQRRVVGIQDLQLTDEELKNFTLLEIEKIFHTNGKSLQNFPNMPLPDKNLINDGSNKLIQQELNFDRSLQDLEHKHLFSSLTEEQKMIYQIILNSTSDVHGGFYFVYGYGGTGKTYVWRTLSASLRSKGEIVLNVASSGVAALLLPSGRTAHSRFGIPLTISEGSFCKITPGTELAALMLKAKLIIWDEAPMMSRFCLEALDRSLKDISPKEKKLIPFAGKTVVLGGDFRQILPVIPMGSREDIVYASICSSSGLWDHCQILRLTKNMRLTVGQMLSPSTMEEIKQFSDWMLQIGEGRIGTEVDGETLIDIPDDLLIPTSDDHVAAIVESTYPNLLEKFSNHSYLEERAILSPTNSIVQTVNDHIMSMIHGEEREYLSADTICKTYVDGQLQQDIYSTDFLNSIKCSGIPNHVLKLKIGVPVMLIRNMDQAAGLCNGTRLVVTQLGDRIIEAKILSGKNIGTKVYIPRMALTPSDSRVPFKFTKRQYPLIVCFAMTINKSQGQTLANVGLYLPKPVFSHGQLYVALSRVKSRKGLKILCCDEDGVVVNKTVNVVYKEIFQKLK